MMLVYVKSLEALKRIGVVARRIATLDLDLARQLRRSGASMTLNIAEAEHGLGGRKRLSFSVALGSARETRAAIHAAEALGYVEPGTNEDLLAKLEEVIRILYVLAK